MKKKKKKKKKRRGSSSLSPGHNIVHTHGVAGGDDADEIVIGNSECNPSQVYALC